MRTGQTQAALAILLAAFVICMPAEELNDSGRGGAPMAFALKSSAFAAGAEIPKKFTCQGPDVSPALEWSGPPAKTAGYALIVDDPDAPVGTWVHWVFWNLPADTHSLGEDIAKHEQLEDGSRQGRNDFRKIGYNGRVRRRARRIATFFACMPWTQNSISRREQPAMSLTPR